MWRPCNQVLDEPARIWIFALEDVGLFLAVLTATAFVLDDPVLGLGLAAGVTGLVYRGKWGKPPGTMRHRLHSWQVLPIPGALSARPTTYSAW